jgi:Arc/MetJ-type ribon-helix-helix transcriptional regulator
MPRGQGRFYMGEKIVVKLRLNQQQLELVDRMIARGVAPDRAALVRLALREYGAARHAKADKKAQS